MQYQLPAATSFWQSQSLPHETFWVERSKVDKPVVMFTVGTMPNSRHAMRELCLAWYPTLHESAEGDGLQQLRDAYGESEEEEEEERSEESECPTIQQTDAAIVGCLWMDMMSSMLEPKRLGDVLPGWMQLVEVASQQRKFSSCADMWNYIMHEGTCDLPAIEGVCREEAAKRQPLVSHTDVGWLAWPTHCVAWKC